MCVHPDTRQRIVDTFSIPKDISVVKTKGVQDGVELTWSDGHVSFHPYEYLKNQSRHSNRLGVRKRPKATAILRKFKTQSPSNPISPTVSYSSVMSEDTGVLRWLENVYTWGFCFVEDTPVDPESTEALLKRIAFIRHTHYGGFWDFTADLTFKDTAYTTEPLGAHTDNTYFTDPSRLQLFHLLSHTEGEGGASLLVDGFQATQTLQKENKEHAITLQSTKHSYHSSGNADIVIQPLIQKTVLGVRSYRGPIMQQIRWNNYDRVVKMDWKLDEQQAWYEAASHFNEIIRRPEMEIWTQLKPGTALLFDNWRMLHGRSEFTGKRRMCGGYINNDDFISRFRVLKFGRDCMIKNFGNMVMHKQNPYSYF
ncbi:putative trimethyllysine dioxygenase [Aspergillus californicus]